MHHKKRKRSQIKQTTTNSHCFVFSHIHVFFFTNFPFCFQLLFPLLWYCTLSYIIFLLLFLFFWYYILLIESRKQKSLLTNAYKHSSGIVFKVFQRTSCIYVHACEKRSNVLWEKVVRFTSFLYISHLTLKVFHTDHYFAQAWEREKDEQKTNSFFSLSLYRFFLDDWTCVIIRSIVVNKVQRLHHTRIHVYVLKDHWST